MASSNSTPPHPARPKQLAVFSPPHESRYNRDQSEIALKWRSKEKDGLKALEIKIIVHEEEISRLQDALAEASEEKKALKCQVEALEGEN